MSSILSKLLHKTKRKKSLLANEDNCSLKDAKQALGASVVSCDEMRHVCTDILSGLGNCSVPFDLYNAKYLDVLEKILKVAEGHVEGSLLIIRYR
jgi:neuroblastoma-amplified sequence